MRFLYGDRELWLGAQDPMSAPVEVIVSATTTLLEPADETAQRIHEAAGKSIQQEKMQMLKEHGEIASGMAVYTSAGDLSFKALIHAVRPLANDEDCGSKIAQAVSNSLLLCETNDWDSIAFPLIDAGRDNNVDIAACSQAFYHSITRFWDARLDSAITKIMLCLTGQTLQPFFDAFREQAHIREIEEPPRKNQNQKQKEQSIGYVDLSENAAADMDEDIQDWFK